MYRNKAKKNSTPNLSLPPLNKALHGHTWVVEFQPSWGQATDTVVGAEWLLYRMTALLPANRFFDHTAQGCVAVCVVCGVDVWKCGVCCFLGGRV